jgi:hypothetical protein
VLLSNRLAGAVVSVGYGDFIRRATLPRLIEREYVEFAFGALETEGKFYILLVLVNPE